MMLPGKRSPTGLRSPLRKKGWPPWGFWRNGLPMGNGQPVIGSRTAMPVRGLQPRSGTVRAARGKAHGLSGTASPANGAVRPGRRAVGPRDRAAGPAGGGAVPPNGAASPSGREPSRQAEPPARQLKPEVHRTEPPSQSRRADGDVRRLPAFRKGQKPSPAHRTGVRHLLAGGIQWIACISSTSTRPMKRCSMRRPCRSLKSREYTSQLISPPIILTLSMQEEELLKKYMDVIYQAWALRSSPSAGNEYAVRAVPANLFSMAKKELLMEMLDGLSEDSGAARPEIDLRPDRLHVLQGGGQGKQPPFRTRRRTS